MVRHLLERDDIEVNAPNGTGDTPLTYVVLRGYEPVARLLLEHTDMDVNPTGKNNNKPLICAAAQGERDGLQW